VEGGDWNWRVFKVEWVGVEAVRKTAGRGQVVLRGKLKQKGEPKEREKDRARCYLPYKGACLIFSCEKKLRIPSVHSIGTKM
jgi:hypothetical protein